MSLKILRQRTPPGKPDQLPAPILVIGAAHTGKSEYVSTLFDRTAPAVIIGTGTVDEPSFADRRAELMRTRPRGWRTIETCDDIPGVIQKELGTGEQIIVDSINQWIAAQFVGRASKYSPDQISQQLEAEWESLLAILRSPPMRTRIALVTSEVGAGTTPPGALERAYRQTMGRLNTRMAACCASVVLMSAGIPMVIKGPV